MVAGSYTLCIAATPGSATESLCSRSPVSSGKISPPHVRLPLSGLTCSPSLVASEMHRPESVDFWKMESAFSCLFFNAEESFDNGQVNSLDVEQISKAPWHILETGEEEDPKQGGAISAPLLWRDASLRYANVMWFKGAYNAEIICGENESEESILRRFRQAVSRAGVIRECQRRRYLESPQDTIKRKQLTAAINRKRSKSSSTNPSSAQNAWKLSTDNLKPVDHSKKKKSSRKNYRQFRFDAAKKGGSDEQTNDIDDDYWGYGEEEVEEPKRSSH